MITPRYYGLRRVNPFLGVLQVAEVEGARALSPNGSRWQLELLSETAVRQPLWADIGPASAERRFFTFGLWSRTSGLRRLPVNPMLGDQSGHPALAALIAALEAMPALPFAPVDGLELWLLDAANAPLALISALRGGSPPTLPYPPGWRAVATRELRTPAEEDPPPAQARQVEERVAAAAGTPARAQWFRREAAGSGTGLGGLRLGPGLEGRTLPAAAFPELLLQESWQDPAAHQAVADLIAWQAPLLLTLHGLARATRDRLEPLAARRPMALYRQRRLLPEVANRSTVDAALVQAVIRSTA
ncbi:MAG: hypothetical protein MUF66_08175 [Gammaproteobacteria bacterium]|nr:hypothetical protein [Gammaproteobacteria bacterium]